jgi:hypothetical protein
MLKRFLKNSPWDAYSLFIILTFSLLQILRWRIFPQFMDIYYHLETVWGFIRAGGYSGWDFWQYAPVGRIHTYPPFFHLVLVFLVKLGINKIILAKLFEAFLPVLFLITLWHFIRKYYNSRLAFFVLLSLSSSFSFNMSLTNYLAATLAIIIGLLAVGQLLEKNSLRSLLLLSLCFYTHIGVSFFFAIGIILFALLDREHKECGWIVFLSAIFLSMPIILKQLAGLKYISIFGISNENYSCEFKTIEYLLAFLGIFICWRRAGKYKLFLCLFLASFIFLSYPYRFFSAQGYLPLILLSGLALDTIYEKFSKKETYWRYLPFFLGIYLLFFSCTILMVRQEKINSIGYKINFADSALTKMLLPEWNERSRLISIWLPGEYTHMAQLIKEYSREDDIVYSSIYYLGVCFASISERATANSLFPEIGASKRFDRLAASKIIITLQDDDPAWINYIVNKYNLVKKGESRLFVLYQNLSCQDKAKIGKATVNFWQIGLMGLAFMLLFWAGKVIRPERIFSLIK